MIKRLTIVFILLHTLLLSQNADINLLRDINLNRNKDLDKPFKFITETRSVVSVGTFCVFATKTLAYHDSASRQNTINIAGGLLFSALVTHAIKLSVRRPRPYKTYPEIEKLSSGGSFSMPSGHTSEAFATATSLSLCYPKWYVITPSFIWAGLVGYSRMHLGVHYPSDVAIGALVGSGTSFFSYWLSKKIFHKTKHHDDVPVTD